MHIEKDFEELFGLLNKNKVRYCIIGSYAVAFHARPRYTKDIDLFVEPSLENAKKILKTLNEFGFASLRLSEKDFMKEKNIIQLGYEPVRINLLTSVVGSNFKEIWKTRKKGYYGKHPVNFMGFDELVKNKKKTNRKQDKADLEVLKKRKSSH